MTNGEAEAIHCRLNIEKKSGNFISEWAYEPCRSLRSIVIIAKNFFFQVLKKLPTYLRMPSLEVTEEYREGFMRAVNTVLHQLVFCPRERKLRPLNEPEGQWQTGNFVLSMSLKVSTECKFNTDAHHSPTLVKGNCPLSLLVR